MKFNYSQRLPLQTTGLVLFRQFSVGLVLSSLVLQCVATQALAQPQTAAPRGQGEAEIGDTVWDLSGSKSRPMKLDPSLYSVLMNPETHDELRTTWQRLQAGEWALAEKALREYVEKTPDDVNGQYFLAKILLTPLPPSQTKPTIEGAPPQNTPPSGASPRREEARRILAGIIAKTTHGPSLGELIRLSLEDGYVGTAQRLYVRLEGWSPDDAMTLFLGARIKEAQANIDGARKAYVQAISAQPENPVFHNALAALEMKHGRYEAAWWEWSQTLEITRDNGEALLGLASIAEKRQDVAMAQQFYTQGISDRMLASVRLLMANKRNDDALLILKAVEVNNRTNPEYLYPIGAMYMKLEQPWLANRALNAFMNQTYADNAQNAYRRTQARQMLDKLSAASKGQPAHRPAAARRHQAKRPAAQVHKAVRVTPSSKIAAQMSNINALKANGTETTVTQKASQPTTPAVTRIQTPQTATAAQTFTPQTHTANQKAPTEGNSGATQTATIPSPVIENPATAASTLTTVYAVGQKSITEANASPSARYDAKPTNTNSVNAMSSNVIPAGTTTTTTTTTPSKPVQFQSGIAGVSGEPPVYKRPVARKPAGHRSGTHRSNSHRSTVHHSGVHKVPTTHTVGRHEVLEESVQPGVPTTEQSSGGATQPQSSLPQASWPGIMPSSADPSGASKPGALKDETATVAMPGDLKQKDVREMTDGNGTFPGKRPGSVYVVRKTAKRPARKYSKSAYGYYYYKNGHRYYQPYGRKGAQGQYRPAASRHTGKSHYTAQHKKPVTPHHKTQYK